MEIIKSIDKIKNLHLKNSVVAIGKFDGLHLGHQIIMDKLNESKKENHLRVIFTFSKNPKTVLLNKAVENIFTEEEQIYNYEKSGVDILIIYPLSNEILKMEPEDFVKNILIEKLDAKKIICGEDFRFGRDRRGDINLLKELGRHHLFKVIEVEKKSSHGEIISSTRIKELLINGDTLGAAKLLGRYFSYTGKVIHGKALGRTIGVPTANTSIPEGKLILPFGVYYTFVVINGKTFKAVSNIGKNPTIEGENEITLETHILNYEGDLYGKILEINFVEYLRTEKKFKGLQELKEQINKDISCVNAQKLPDNIM